ncbi:MAG: leucine-rich repeat domain-containing protein, partial [Ureaplasma sp.]|nr:leucine-rich repeat domain-containing protein [Ureaplasma sp.]
MSFNILREENSIKVETQDITTNINLIKINTSILKNKLASHPLTANELSSLSKTKLLQTLQSFNCGIDNPDLITESSIKLTYNRKEFPILRKANPFTGFGMELWLRCNENSILIIDNQIPSTISSLLNHKDETIQIDNNNNIQISSEDAIAQSLWVFEDSSKTNIIGLSEFGKTQPKLVIPSNVTTIRRILSNEFNTSVKEIQFNDNSHLLNLGEGAFEGFKSLEKINLPSTIKFIGSAAFKNCSKLTSIKIANGIDNDFSKLIISEIPWSCFEGCSAINNLKFSQNINEPQNFAFKDCTSLNSITFGNSQPNDFSNTGWSVINESVFENTGAFEKILFPQNLNSIGKRAFAKSKINAYYLNQTNKNDNNKLKFIDDEAFYECKNFINNFGIFNDNTDFFRNNGFIATKIKSLGNRAFANTNIDVFWNG